MNTLSFFPLEFSILKWRNYTMRGIFEVKTRASLAIIFSRFIWEVFKHSLFWLLPPQVGEKNSDLDPILTQCFLVLLNVFFGVSSKLDTRTKYTVEISPSVISGFPFSPWHYGRQHETINISQSFQDCTWLKTKVFLAELSHHETRGKISLLRRESILSSKSANYGDPKI